VDVEEVVEAHPEWDEEVQIHQHLVHHLLDPRLELPRLQSRQDQDLQVPDLQVPEVPLPWVLDHVQWCLDRQDLDHLDLQVDLGLLDLWVAQDHLELWAQDRLELWGQDHQDLQEACGHLDLLVAQDRQVLQAVLNRVLLVQDLKVHHKDLHKVSSNQGRLHHSKASLPGKEVLCLNKVAQDQVHHLKVNSLGHKVKFLHNKANNQDLKLQDNSNPDLQVLHNRVNSQGPVPHHNNRVR